MRILPLAVAILAASLMTVAGCNSAPPPPAVDIAAEQGKLRDLEAAWVRNVAAKDLEKIIANYAGDAVLMAPGEPAAKGKDAVRASWKGLLDSIQKLEFAPSRIEISQAGYMATTNGSYTLTMTDAKTKKPVDDKGSYVTVYKKQADGGWKVIEDVNVSEVAH
jgi:uncharacterized protein (TIGR02246 family)